jgi:PncC family amidohydrolase
MMQNLESLHGAANDEPLEVKVGALLRARGLTLALAESCTGGLIGNLITDVPGSSAYFLGSAVTYAYRAKEVVLGVRHETLARYGAVSAETAREMAQGARRLFGADIAVAVTGIAGPTGGLPDKPVGLVYLHLSADDAEIGERHIWDADRLGNKRRSAEAALALILRYLGQPIEQHDHAGTARGGKMTLPEFVGEPILVQARFLPDGQVQPTAFIWRGRTRYIAEIGRQWQEEADGISWRCYLVHTPTAETFELRLAPGEGRWMLMRAWPRPDVA